MNANQAMPNDASEVVQLHRWPTQRGTLRELIIADGTAPEILELLQGATVPAVALGHHASAAEVLQTITTLLAGERVETLHIVAHGQPGAFSIGGQWIDERAVRQSAALLGQWGVGEVALWSCEVGADSAFVQLLSELTSAPVGATSSALGHVFGQNRWNLETSAAVLPVAASVLGAWPHTLATLSFVNSYAMVYDINNNSTIEGNRGETDAAKEQSSHNFSVAPLGAVTISDASTAREFSGNDVSASFASSSGTLFGWISRPIKDQGIVRGFYFWTDADFTTLSAAQADGNNDRDGTAADNRGYILVVDQAWFDQQIASTRQTVTLNNTIDGNRGSVTYANVGSSSDRVDTALNSLLPTTPPPPPPPGAPTVNDILVNEGSPYAVWTVTGTAGQAVSLALSNDSNTATADATIGTDIGTQLQYFNGTAWVNYTSGTVAVPAGGILLVRVAVNNDTPYEGAETVQLAVTAGTSTVRGTATIVDDGTGNIYPNNNTGSPDPAAPKDDDRVGLRVNSIDVNERSPYAVFEVSGTAGQSVTLGLSNDTNPATQNATLGVDTGTQLQYYNGSTWVNYTPGSSVTLPAGGKLMVRVTISNGPDYEGPETFLLTATPSSGSAAVGVGTIYDDGTGTIFNLDGTPNNSIAKDDDRGVLINSIQVNEASPYAVFTVSGSPGLLVTLELGTDGDSSTADATLGTDAGTQLQYFNGTSWVNYTPGATVPLGANGQLLVRTAITNDTTFEGAENFVLKATPPNGNVATGTATILDDGTGDIYPDSPSGNPDPNAPKDDDRSIRVNDIEVNEASPYAVFTVNANAGQTVTLALQNDGLSSTANATLGTDAGPSLQYYNGSSWVSYTGGPVTVPAGGVLLVRTTVTNDTTFEGAENFQLKVTGSNGNAVTGNATILDDGTGNIYPDNPTGNPDPNAPKDDDRSVRVNDISVNEASPFAVFTVSGTAGLAVSLALRSDTDPATANATIGTDAGPSLQYFNGTIWVAYTSGTVQIPAGGQLLVRTTVTNDTPYEGAETLQLAATPTGGTAALGTATIYDYGTGNIYPDNTTGNPDPTAIKDDDRVVKVNNIEVNEASPYAVFTITAAAGQALSLSLQNDNDPNTANATLGTDAGPSLEYYNGTAWVPYTGGTVTVPAGGKLLVRTTVTNDTTFEGPEALQLKVSPTGGVASYGTATILDDGTGDIYPNNPTGTPDPAAPKDDDRAVKVNNILVNEGSPYAVFTVTAAGGQALSLGLQNDTDLDTADAKIGTDAGPALEYYNGTAWVPYTGGTVTVPASGTLLVRTTVTNDTVYEGPEALQLRVTTSNGASSYGTATIVDDGTGNIYPNNPTGAPDPAAPKDDDRPKLTATLDPLSDTGARDFITRDYTPEFTLTTPTLLAPGRIAQLVDPNGNVIGSTTITAADVAKGNVNVPTPPLNDGTYTYTARILDVDGKVLGTAPVYVTVITDIDGVSPAVELAANGGDYNRDGVLDWQQNNVAQLPVTSYDAYLAGVNATASSFGAFMVGGLNAASPVGVQLDPGAQLRDVAVKPVPANAPALPTGLTAVTPLYQFSVGSLEGSSVGDASARAGLQVRTVLDIPGGVNATAYLKYNTNTNTWSNYTNAAAVDSSVDGAALLDTNGDGRIDRVVISITDGGVGDEDGVVNGSITDPGLLALSASAAPVPAAPVISGDAQKAIYENRTPVTNFTANEPVTWSVSGGNDAPLFTINDKGELVFKAAPDFERPRDNGTDNFYNLQIKATNAAGVSSVLSVVVQVLNVEEGIPIFFSDKAVATDRTLSTTPASAAEGGQIQFFATPRTDAQTAPLKAWYNPLTGDWFYGLEGVAPPYDCYVERPDVVLGRVLKAGQGAFTVNTYLDGNGNTQIVSAKAAAEMGLLSKGYRDLGSTYQFDSSDVSADLVGVVTLSNLG